MFGFKLIRKEKLAKMNEDYIIATSELDFKTAEVRAMKKILGHILKKSKKMTKTEIVRLCAEAYEEVE